MIATSRSTISCITRQIGGPASCHVNERFIDYTITIFIHIYIYTPSVIVCINFLDLEKSSNFVLRPANRHILISKRLRFLKIPSMIPNFLQIPLTQFTEGVSNTGDSTLLPNSLKTSLILSIFY